MQTWEANVRRVVPYTPGEQPDHQDMIKLNTNENPYPPAPGVQKLSVGLNRSQLRLYPDPAADDLVKAIAEACGAKNSRCLWEWVLTMACYEFSYIFNGKKPILFPDITYSFYDVWAELFLIPYERPVLDEHFHIKKKIISEKTEELFFPIPMLLQGSPVSCGCGRDCGA